MAKLDQLVGKIVKEVIVDSDKMRIITVDNLTFLFSCCENVEIVSVFGNLEDLIASPVLYVDVDSSYGGEDFESSTITEYTFKTAKGTVKVEWLGTSNGYYSEDVDLEVFETEK